MTLVRKRGFLIGLVFAVASCTSSYSKKDTAANLVFLTREGCVNSATMRTNLEEALRILHRPVTYQLIDQGALAPTDARAGYPTPTLLAGNRDVFGMPTPTPPFPEPT